MTVHPRSCGDHVGLEQNAIVRCGSSPLMRGPRPTIASVSAHCRFIPAHAGTTIDWLPSIVVSTVHPRSCGDHLLSVYSKVCFYGSSPLMRGPPQHTEADSILTRFIPAHAGTTCAETSNGSPLSVHPRSCGDHGVGRYRHGHCGGSSPLMRGPREGDVGHFVHGRFIPAHAGTTHWHMFHLTDGNGSSPLMRGPRNCRGIPCSRIRFIPAHAGTT